MSQIKYLYDLQELDWGILGREQSLLEVRASLSDNAAVESAAERLQQLESRLTDLAPNRHQIESEIQRIDDKRKHIERRLYSGSVTNPRELSAYEEEGNFLRIQQQTAEDELLAIMIEMEDLQTIRNGDQETLTRLESERSKELIQLEKSQERLIGEVDNLNHIRNETTPRIPANTLSVYESLKKSRKGYAVAKIERGLCQGCRLALPTMELQRARWAQEIVQCSSCRRILYVV